MFHAKGAILGEGLQLARKSDMNALTPSAVAVAACEVLMTLAFRGSLAILSTFQTSKSGGFRFTREAALFVRR